MVDVNVPKIAATLACTFGIRSLGHERAPRWVVCLEGEDLFFGCMDDNGMA